MWIERQHWRPGDEQGDPPQWLSSVAVLASASHKIASVRKGIEQFTVWNGGSSAMLAAVLFHVCVSHPRGVRTGGIVFARPGTSSLRAAGGVTRSGSDGFC